MARGKKTGGRNFRKRDPITGEKDPRAGRTFGAKDKVPRGSIKSIFAALSKQEPELFDAVIRRGLKGKSAYHFLQLAAYYIDGRPAQTVIVQPDISRLSHEELEWLERIRLKLDNAPGEETP